MEHQEHMVRITKYHQQKGRHLPASQSQCKFLEGTRRRAELSSSFHGDRTLGHVLNHCSILIRRDGTRENLSIVSQEIGLRIIQMR